MQLAQQPRSEVETRWAEEISASYPGWRPPRTYAQAVEYQAPGAGGAATAEASVSEREEIPPAVADQTQENTAPTASVDPLSENSAPEQAVDQAADGESTAASEGKADAPEVKEAAPDASDGTAEKAAAPELKITDGAPAET